MMKLKKAKSFIVFLFNFLLTTKLLAKNKLFPNLPNNFLSIFSRSILQFDYP